MTDLSVRPDINVLDPDFYVDPWEAYRWLRDEAPVYWDPVQQLWAISRYEDIVAIERDGQRYSSFSGSRPHIDLSGDRSMINMDDPSHQAQRNLVARRFTPRGVRTHEEHVREVVTRIIDRIGPQGECEAIRDLASVVPAVMIGDLLGYPREMWQKVRHWAEQIMYLAGQSDITGPPHVPHPGLGPVIQEFVDLTVPVIRERMTEPRNDLISQWATADGWDMEHIIDEVILVLNGGAETTRTVIGSMIRELALQPEQRRLLVGDPGLMGTSGVEEFIRWVTPVLNMRRTATESHDLHGRHIEAGQELLLLYGSANRDPRAFSDPDVLDVTRAHNRHVAFGFGTHFCLGAHLARLEIRVTFEELLRRIPDWELVDPSEPQILPASFARAFNRVRIRYTPTS